MSHVTTIDPATKYDLPALKQMCKNEGWEFIEGKKEFAWFGRHVGDYPLPEGFKVEDMGKCDHAIHIPGCKYEVGVVQKDGRYMLLYDFFRPGGLKDALCNGQQDTQAGLLKQAYGMAKAQVACRQKGRSWSQQSVKNRAGWKKLVVNMAY